MAEEVTSQLSQFGMYTSTSKEQAIEHIKEAIKKFLEPLLVRNTESVVAYIAQLKLLVETLKANNVSEPFEKYEKVRTSIGPISRLSDLQKNKEIKDLENLIQKEFSAIKSSPEKTHVASLRKF